jgi:molybdopterin converting factor small subunit
MNVRIQLFATLRLQTGKKSVDLDVPEGSSVAYAIAQFLQLIDPSLHGQVVDRERGGYALVILLDGQPIAADTLQQDGQTVALLPPLGGGCPQM